jgi:hypothetical protein
VSHVPLPIILVFFILTDRRTAGVFDAVLCRPEGVARSHLALGGRRQCNRRPAGYSRHAADVCCELLMLTESGAPAAVDAQTFTVDVAGVRVC